MWLRYACGDNSAVVRKKKKPKFFNQPGECPDRKNTQSDAGLGNYQTFKLLAMDAVAAHTGCYFQGMAIGLSAETNPTTQIRSLTT